MLFLLHIIKFYEITAKIIHHASKFSLVHHKNGMGISWTGHSQRFVNNNLLAIIIQPFGAQT